MIKDAYLSYQLKFNQGIFNLSGMQEISPLGFLRIQFGRFSGWKVNHYLHINRLNGSIFCVGYSLVIYGQKCESKM